MASSSPNPFQRLEMGELHVLRSERSCSPQASDIRWEDKDPDATVPEMRRSRPDPRFYVPVLILWLAITLVGVELGVWQLIVFGSFCGGATFAEVTR